MILFFTSGTVSYPKMVHAPAASYGLGHVDDRALLARPAARATATGPSPTPAGRRPPGAGSSASGTSARRSSRSRSASPTPTRSSRIIRDAEITSFCAPPTLYRMLVQADLAAYDLSTLRHCTSAGEPLNPEVIRAWKEGTGGLTVYDGYGQSETTVLVANYRAVPVRPGLDGQAGAGLGRRRPRRRRRRAADDDVVGNDRRRRSPTRRPVGLFDEYFGDDAREREVRSATAGTTRGDKAWRDGDGYLWFEGRDDDVITSSAYRIGPFEVESALVEHPAVVEAAVVGKDDPERTQIVSAFVHPRRRATSRGDDARERAPGAHPELTAPYKYPREIHFVDELPKTVSGKIRRSELRDRLRTEIENS